MNLTPEIKVPSSSHLNGISSIFRLVMFGMLSAFGTYSTHAMELSVRAYHVEEKLFEPLLKLSQEDDSAGLNETFPKLDKLAESGTRVQKLLDVKLLAQQLEGGGYKGSSHGNINPAEPFGKSKKRVMMGSNARFSPQQLGRLIKLREYKINYLSAPKTVHNLYFTLISSLRENWTLAAVIKLENGGFFLFEKGSGQIADTKLEPAFVSAYTAFGKRAKEPESWYQSENFPGVLLVSPDFEGQNNVDITSLSLMGGSFNATLKSKLHLSHYPDGQLGPDFDQSFISDSSGNSFDQVEISGRAKLTDAQSKLEVVRVYTLRETKFQGNGSYTSRPMKNKKEAKVFFSKYPIKPQKGDSK